MTGERLLVGEAVVDPDRRASEPLGGQDPLGVELEEGADGVPRSIGLEAGQTVREDLRKHGDDAIGQIDAGAAVLRSAVESGAGPDEVRHVGDVDPQAPVTLFVARQRDGVVEVARGGRVDRHAEHLAEVFAMADLGLVESLGLVASIIEDGLDRRYRGC